MLMGGHVTVGSDRFGDLRLNRQIGQASRSESQRVESRGPRTRFAKVSFGFPLKYRSNILWPVFP